MPESEHVFRLVLTSPARPSMTPGCRTQSSGVPGSMQRGAMAGRYPELSGDTAGEARSTWSRKEKSWMRAVSKWDAVRLQFHSLPVRSKPKDNAFISSFGTNSSPAPVSHAYTNVCLPADRGTNSAPGSGLRGLGGHRQLIQNANFHGSQSIARSNKTNVTFTPSVLTAAC